MAGGRVPGADRGESTPGASVGTGVPELVQRNVARRLSDQVEIVQNQDQRAGHCFQGVVDQGADHASSFRLRASRTGQKGLRPVSTGGNWALQGGDQASQETGGFVIVLVQRELGHGKVEQSVGRRGWRGRLTVTSESGDQGQRVCDNRTVEFGRQLLARDHIRMRMRGL